MTDPQIPLDIAYIKKSDIVNNTYELNLSNEQIAALSANACIAVIGGLDYEGESFNTLRLFKNKTLTENYIVELLGVGRCAYVGVQIQGIGEKAYIDRE